MQVMLAVSHDWTLLPYNHLSNCRLGGLRPNPDRDPSPTKKRKNTAASRYAGVLDLRPGGRRGTRDPSG